LAEVSAEALAQFLFANDKLILSQIYMYCKKKTQKASKIEPENLFLISALSLPTCENTHRKVQPLSQR